MHASESRTVYMPTTYYRMYNYVLEEKLFYILFDNYVFEF